jgi:Ulp1 family protease
MTTHSAPYPEQRLATMSNRTNKNLILNYHDAVIYQSDLDILKSSSAWLNDACVNFYFTRLQVSIRSNNTSFKFMDPSVLSFFMHQWDEEEDRDDDVLGLLMTGQNNKRLYFLPINDNYVSQRWTTPGGGCHWSLMLMIVTYMSDDDGPPSIGFWHFDSSEGSGNIRAATSVAQKIQRVIMNHSVNTTNNNSQQTALPVRQCSVSQQQNGYDCGLHALATAEAIANACCATEDMTLDTTALVTIVKRSVATSPSYFRTMRQRMVKDIEVLAAAAEIAAEQAS